MLDFTPSEISFYEQDAKTFLVLDKQDPDRKVRLFVTHDVRHCWVTEWMNEPHVPVRL